MNNKLFQGLLMGALLWQGTAVFIADAAPAKPAKPAKPAAKPAAKPEAKAEPEQVILSSTLIRDAGIRYELTSCKREGETPVVVCRLLLTNKKKDDVAVSFKVAGTRFIDKDGEEYRAKEVKIGSVKSDSEAENTLISDTPTRATVTFDAPPANVLTMRVLAINHSPGSSLKFRDVKIGK
jgi:hypothetical protein